MALMPSFSFYTLVAPLLASVTGAMSMPYVFYIMIMYVTGTDGTINTWILEILISVCASYVVVQSCPVSSSQ